MEITVSEPRETASGALILNRDKCHHHHCNTATTSVEGITAPAPVHR